MHDDDWAAWVAGLPEAFRKRAADLETKLAVSGSNDSRAAARQQVIGQLQAAPREALLRRLKRDVIDPLTDHETLQQDLPVYRALSDEGASIDRLRALAAAVVMSALSSTLLILDDGHESGSGDDGSTWGLVGITPADQVVEAGLIGLHEDVLGLVEDDNLATAWIQGRDPLKKTPQQTDPRPVPTSAVEIFELRPALQGYPVLETNRADFKLLWHVEGQPLLADWPAPTVTTRSDTIGLSSADALKIGLQIGVNERAFNLFSALAGDDVEWLPVATEYGQMHVLNVLRFADILDTDKSDIGWIDGGRISHIPSFVGRTDYRDTLPPFFKLPQMPRGPIYVTTAVRDLIAREAITGLETRTVGSVGTP